MFLLFHIFQLLYHLIMWRLNSYISFILICQCLVSIHNGHSDMMVFQRVVQWLDTGITVPMEASSKFCFKSPSLQNPESFSGFSASFPFSNWPKSECLASSGCIWSEIEDAFRQCWQSQPSLTEVPNLCSTNCLKYSWYRQGTFLSPLVLKRALSSI